MSCLRLLPTTVLADVGMDNYSIYVRTYGKAASGSRITEADFRTNPVLRFISVPFRPSGQAAAALAVQDVSKETAIRSRTEVEAELRRLLG